MDSIKNKESIEAYTLIETVVAMAIYLSVLLPLVGTLGNVMFDRKSATLQAALATAQTEMQTVAVKKDFTESKHKAENGLVVARTIQKQNQLVQIRVVIKTSLEQTKEIVVLKCWLPANG